VDEVKKGSVKLHDAVKVLEEPELLEAVKNDELSAGEAVNAVKERSKQHIFCTEDEVKKVICHLRKSVKRIGTSDYIRSLKQALTVFFGELNEFEINGSRELSVTGLSMIPCLASPRQKRRIS